MLHQTRRAVAIPNWCHDSLTVTGEPEEVARFVAAVRESDQQPLSFAKLVPEPSEEEYAAIDDANKTTCRLCGGKGKRPVTQEEADEWGVVFYEGVMPVVPFEDRRHCNGCSGSGRALPSYGENAWWNWRLSNWGCKWDASFGGPFMALGSETMDVEACVEAEGVVHAPGTAIFKFDTPCSPPSPFVERASEQFPDLEFRLRFGEPGVEFAGEERYVAGICIEQQELSVEDVLQPEEMWY